MKMTSDEIRDILAHNICQAEFIKKNGEYRLMKCTLHPDYLPKIEGEPPEARKNENSVAVWNLNDSNWRSFTINRLMSLEILKELN